MALSLNFGGKQQEMHPTANQVLMPSKYLAVRQEMWSNLTTWSHILEIGCHVLVTV